MIFGWKISKQEHDKWSIHDKDGMCLLKGVNCIELVGVFEDEAQERAREHAFGAIKALLSSDSAAETRVNRLERSTYTQVWVEIEQRQNGAQQGVER